MKKMIIISLTILLLGIGTFLITENFSSLASELNEYDLEWAIEEGYVIQQGDQILNLIRLQEFFENVNNGIDDSIITLNNSFAHSNEISELHYQDGALLLYYDIRQDSQSSKKYRIKKYDSMIRTLRHNQIEFLLVSKNNEKTYLFYSLSND